MNVARRGAGGGGFKEIRIILHSDKFFIYFFPFFLFFGITYCYFFQYSSAL